MICYNHSRRPGKSGHDGMLDFQPRFETEKSGCRLALTVLHRNRCALDGNGTLGRLARHGSPADGEVRQGGEVEIFPVHLALSGIRIRTGVEAFEELLVDELDRKYKNDRWRKYEDEPSEFKAFKAEP